MSTQPNQQATTTDALSAQAEFDLGPGLRLEAQIAGSDVEGIRARWEFGRWLLSQRVGKKLPAGLLDQLAAATGQSRTELQYRVRFAERYPDEDALCNALHNHSSWHAVINDALAATPKADPGSEETDGPAIPTLEWVRSLEHTAAAARHRIEHHDLPLAEVAAVAKRGADAQAHIERLVGVAKDEARAWPWEEIDAACRSDAASPRMSRRAFSVLLWWKARHIGGESPEMVAEIESEFPDLASSVVAAR